MKDILTRTLLTGAAVMVVVMLLLPLPAAAQSISVHAAPRFEPAVNELEELPEDGRRDFTMVVDLRIVGKFVCVQEQKVSVEVQPVPHPDWAGMSFGPDDARFVTFTLPVGNNDGYSDTQSGPIASLAWDTENAPPNHMHRYVVDVGAPELSGDSTDCAPSIASASKSIGQALLNVTYAFTVADSVKVTGTVVDATDGSPVSCASVLALNQEWGNHNSTQTAEDGNFTIWVKPGYVILEVRAREHYWVSCQEKAMPAEDSASSSDSCGVRAIGPAPYCGPRDHEHAYFPRFVSFVAVDGQAKDFNASLVRSPKPDATFTGWVVNASSQEGIEDAVVRFYNERTRDRGQATTDADGSYKIQVHAGYYTVRADAHGTFDGVLNAEIASGATKTLNVVLEPGQKRWAYPCCFHHGGEMYRGEGGGLGAYGPAADLDGDGGDALDRGGGDAPGFGPLVAALAALAALALIRGRRD